MEGTEKQVKWATEIKAAYAAKLKTDEKRQLTYQPEEYPVIREKMETRGAKFWIDNRLNGFERMSEAIVGRQLSKKNLIF